MFRSRPALFLARALFTRTSAVSPTPSLPATFIRFASKAPPAPLINSNIPHETVCYVDQATGKLTPPTPLAQALASFDQQQSSLLLVDGNKNPPICRIVPNESLVKSKDSTKDKKAGAKKQLADKTVTLRWTVAQNDLVRKLEGAKKFLVKGHRVNLTWEGPFDGKKPAKEAALKQVTEQLMNMIKDSEDAVKVKEWQQPKMTMRESTVYLQPLKN